MSAERSHEGADPYAPLGHGGVIERNTTGDAAPQWSAPQPLDPPRVPAEFPLDALPGWAGEYAAALAEFTQTPPDLAGACVLGVIAACAGGRTVVEARPGWREPTNLYLLPVLRPGSRKSAVIAAATRPLYAVEQDLVKSGRDGIAEALTVRDIAQKVAEKARATAAAAIPEKRAAALSEAVSAAGQAEACTVPPVPRLIADDATPEAAVSLLCEQGGRLAVISAEGGVFDMMAGRYSKIPSLDLWLKGHAGDMLRIDRKGRPAEYIPHPALTLLLTVQPVVLAGIAKNGTFRGRGLLARFLYSIPASNIGHRRIGATAVPVDITEAYEQNVRKLVEDLAGWVDPAVLLLDGDAHELLLRTEREIEPRLGDDGDLGSGSLAEWGSKLAGAIVRIAGLLHVADDPGAFRRPITAATLTAAIRIGGYYAEHARAAFGLLGETGSSDARYLLNHLARRVATTFTVRELLTDLPRGRFGKVEDVAAAVTVLEDHGYVQRRPDPDRRGPGRKPSPSYDVHPDLSAESAESAQ